MVLQRLFGLSDREAVQAFEFDARWKYACGGLDFNYQGFAHMVLVDMRARLARSERPKRIFEVSLDAAREAGVVSAKRVLNSTPLYDAVATQDTVTMIRSAIRRLLVAVDSGLETELRSVLSRDDDYASGGKPVCDWDDPVAREQLVADLAGDAFACLAVLEGRDLMVEVTESAELLATVVGQDLEAGGDGRFHIARKVAKDRVISTVDPDTRHGHKTRARGFDGYKGHVAVDPDSEIITDTTVTPCTDAAGGRWLKSSSMTSSTTLRSATTRRCLATRPMGPVSSSSSSTTTTSTRDVGRSCRPCRRAGSPRTASPSTSTTTSCRAGVTVSIRRCVHGDGTPTSLSAAPHARCAPSAPTPPPVAPSASSYSRPRSPRTRAADQPRRAEQPPRPARHPGRAAPTRRPVAPRRGRPGSAARQPARHPHQHRPGVVPPGQPRLGRLPRNANRGGTVTALDGAKSASLQGIFRRGASPTRMHHLHAVARFSPPSAFTISRLSSTSEGPE